MFSAMLRFVDPARRKFDCAEMAMRCMLLMNHPHLSEDDNGTAAWPKPLRLLLAVLDTDITHAIQLLHSIVGDRWATAHLADLMGHAQAIETVSLDYDNDLNDPRYRSKGHPEQFMVADQQVGLREYFVLQYALQMGLGGRMPVHGTHSPNGWRTAAIYLGAMTRTVELPCGTQVQLGRIAMETILTRQALVSERFTDKLVRACDNMDLPDVATRLCLARAMRWWCLSDGHTKTSASTFEGVGNALLWANRAGPEHGRALIRQVLSAGNTAALDTLVDHLGPSLQAVSITAAAAADGDMNDTDIENDGGMSLDADMVKLLSAYHRFRSSLKRASEKLALLPKHAGALTPEIDDLRREAAMCLCQVIESNEVPRSFWAGLIRQLVLWGTSYSATATTHSSSLTDCHPLVRESAPPMTLGQASSLVRCMEQLSVSYDSSKLVGPQSDMSTRDLSVVRLALLQSMARAVTLQGVADVWAQ
jgi:hypothetical protein